MRQRGSGGAAPAPLAPGDWPPEQRLVAALAAWATWSTGLGAVLWGVGRRDGVRGLVGAGRVSVAWGLADAGVAGWGAWRSRGAGGDDPARARRMAMITGANALLDVAYVAGGVRWARVPGRRGEGWATTVQGLALLYLDTRYALEFAALGRRAGREAAPGPLHSGGARERRRPARAGRGGPPANDSPVVPVVVRAVP